MTRLLHIPARALRRFGRDGAGAISTEAVLVMPVLLWVFMAMFVYWDAYRVQNGHIKASYTVSDMISRENTAINTAYIFGMHEIYRYLSMTDEATLMRVSSVQYRISDNSYRVLWSRTTSSGRAPAHTTATMAAQRDRLPKMADSHTTLVVETWRDFTPVLSVGLPQRTFYQFTAVRPRFLSPLPIS